MSVLCYYVSYCSLSSKIIVKFSQRISASVHLGTNIAFYKSLMSWLAIHRLLTGCNGNLVNEKQVQEVTTYG